MPKRFRRRITFIRFYIVCFITREYCSYWQTKTGPHIEQFRLYTQKNQEHSFIQWRWQQEVNKFGEKWMEKEAEKYLNTIQKLDRNRNENVNRIRWTQWNFYCGHFCILRLVWNAENWDELQSSNHITVKNMDVNIH